MINKIKYILSFGYVKLLVACILAGVFISSMLGIVYIASIGGDKTPVLARVSNQTITKKQLDSKMSDLDKLGITKLSREDVLSSMINCKIAGLEAIKFDFDANGNEINQSTDNALSTYYPDFDQDQKNIIRQDVKCEVLASKLKNVYLAFSGGSYLSINVPISYAADSGTSAPTYQQFLDQDKSAQELANKISQDLAAGTINVNDAASLIASNPANVNIDSKIKTDFTKNDFLSNNDIFSDGAIKDQVFSKIQNDIKIDSNVGKTDIGSATAGLVPSLGSDDETYQTASADIRQITPVVTNQIMHDTAGNISKQWLVISPSQYKEGGYQNVDDLQPDLYKTYQVSYRIDPKDDFKNNFNFINGQNLLSQQSTSSSAGSSDYTKVAGATSDCTLGKIKFEAPADRVKNNKIIAPAAVDFTVSGGTGVNYYHWSFGDPGSEPHASASGAKLTYRHLYNYGGNYTITLYGYDRVVKKDGKVVLNDCGTKTVTIDLNGPAAPDTRCNLGDLGASPRSGKQPLKVSFSSSGDSNVNYYHWSFGDPGSEPHASASGERSNVNHTYNNGGTYTATLTGYRKLAETTTNCGSKTITITVTGTSQPTPIPGTTPTPAPTPGPTPSITPNPNHTPGISSLTPAKGPVGTKIIIKAKTDFSGHFQVNLQSPDGKQTTNVANLISADGGKTLTFVFPATPCSAGQTCAQSVANPGVWKIWLVDVTNPTGSPIVGNKVNFTLTPSSTPTSKPTTTPTSKPTTAPTPTAKPGSCQINKITATPDHGTAPLKVTLTADVSNANRYRWQLDSKLLSNDWGKTSTLKHTLSKEGSYTFTLQAKKADSNNDTMCKKSITVKVNKPGETIKLDIYQKSPTTGQIVLGVKLAIKGENTPSDIYWKITKNGSSPLIEKTIPVTNKNALLKFESDPGTYSVKLTNNGEDGSNIVTSDTVKVTVTPKASNYNAQKMVDYANFYYWDTVKRAECSPDKGVQRSLACTKQDKPTFLNIGNKDNASCFHCQQAAESWFDQVKLKGFSNCVGFVETILYRSGYDTDLMTPINNNILKDPDVTYEPATFKQVNGGKLPNSIGLNLVRAWMIWDVYFKNGGVVGKQYRKDNVSYSNTPKYTVYDIPDPSCGTPDIRPGDILFSVRPYGKAKPTCNGRSAALAVDEAYDDNTDALSVAASDLSTGLGLGSATVPSTNKLFMLGGSIFARLANGSNIKAMVGSNGWNLIDYSAVGGRTLEGGLAVAKQEVNKVKQANDIVVFLGFNNGKDPDAVFVQKLTDLYGYLRSQNPTAKIYWFTYAYYPTDNSANETARKNIALRINKAIKANAAKYDIIIMDWAKEANASDYGPTDGVHPNAAGNAHMASFISQKIGKPKTALVPTPTPATKKSGKTRNSHASIFVGKDHPYCPDSMDGKDVIIEAALGSHGPVCNLASDRIFNMSNYIRVKEN